MSTELNKIEGSNVLHTLPHVDGLTVGIVCAEWNDQITGALLQGALDLFKKEGYEDITVAYVPGTHFYAGGGHENTLRLNFSMADPETIQKGLALLKGVLDNA